MRHDIIEYIKKNPSNWQKLVKNIKIDGIHGVNGTYIEFKFPFTVIAGENGTGKSTILKALSCAYKSGSYLDSSYSPGRLFPKTPWDTESSSEVIYHLKLGDTEKKQIINKPSVRWRIEEKGRKRTQGDVFFFDVNRVRSIESVKGYSKLASSKSEVSSRNLNENTIKSLSEIMDKEYNAGRYAKTDVDQKLEVGILSTSFGNLSQFHQGTGESITLELLSIIEGLPNNSLVLIDEIESSLHPKAQRKMMRCLLEICKTKKMQIIFTTHSEYILNEVPKEFRILLRRISDKEVIAIENPSTELCLTDMDDENHAQLTIACEDERSAVLIRELIRNKNPSIINRIKFITAGSYKNVILLHNLSIANKFPFNVLGVVDPEIIEKNIPKIPGIYPPETQVFLSIIENKLFDKFKDISGKPIEEIEIDMRKTCLIQNHHLWVKKLADSWTIEQEVLWDNLSRTWVNFCADVPEKEELIKKIEAFF